MSEVSSSPLLKIISSCISSSSDQQITFAQYMEMCLYYPEYGYYNSRAIAIGSQGDFFTSASISEDFGELLAKKIKQCWDDLGQPDNFQVVEMGAGEGVLAKIILDYLMQKYPQLNDNLTYLIIEKSQQLKEKQVKMLDDKQYKIKWKEWQDIKNESIVGCFISNELMDALAVHRVIKKNDSLQEIYVTMENGLLTEKYDQLSTLAIERYFQENNVDLTHELYPENYYTEVNLNAVKIIENIGKKLQKGYVITIDYGYDAQKYYHPQRYQGTLKCYYQHRHHNNPYANVGIQDITSHVNFTSLEMAGQNVGLNKIEFLPQALFLMGLGLGDRLNALSNGKMSLNQIWRKRSQLHELINPQGLGGFGVLIQGKNV